MSGRRPTHHHVSRFAFRVFGVRPGAGEWMIHRDACFVEADTVLGLVDPFLFRIPRWLLHVRDDSDGPFTQTYLDNWQVSRG